MQGHRVLQCGAVCGGHDEHNDREKKSRRKCVITLNTTHLKFARPCIIQHLEDHDLAAVEAQRDGSSAENAAGNSEPEVRLH